MRHRHKTTSCSKERQRSLQCETNHNSLTVTAFNVLIFLNIQLGKKIFYFLLFLRETECERRRGREGDTESEAGSRLWALRTEPDKGFKLTYCEIMTWGVVGAAQLTGPPRCPTAPQLYKCLLNLGFGSNQVKDSISLVILNFWEISGTEFPHLQGNFHTMCFSFGLQKPMVFKTLHLLWQ